MTSFKPYPVLLGLAVLFVFARPALAFGAGNIASISKIQGQNWRHGDIEDTLLNIVMARAVSGKKFDKLSVSRTYFGNWLRDYSQAIDVGTVKSVSAEAIRLILCVLGFMTFGYGSREFEVTAERLGTYRPEDHIDNPKNYADNLDARQYDRRLRGPVDERVELAVDEETGMKNYIANENVNIMTSALHVRRLFSKCIELGRNYNRRKNKDELYEALRLLGTGLHCLEDFLAHSNYVELALTEIGERDIFPHVGRSTNMRLRGARGEVYPVVTGTFGGVDFLHSVTGEVSDKLTQNELQDLEGTLQNVQRADTSVLEGLLDKIPDGLLGGDDKKQKMQDVKSNAASTQMEGMRISPREPEETTRYVQTVFQQVMPAIQFHDELMQTISEAIEQIPVLPQLIEQLEDQLSLFVFSIIGPLIIPILSQVKNEMQTGSSEIIQSSKREQHIVFNDDRCTDPTHSMLSKDHFSNILNEIAGKTASKVVAWTTPQIMQAWDDDSIDVDRTLNRIIYGVLHHPAQRDMGEDGAREGRQVMFRSVEEWWNNMDQREQSEYRRKLSRSGVQNGENHKEGVNDTGHGCGKPLGMHKNFGGSGGGSNVENQIAGAAAGAILGSLGGQDNQSSGSGSGKGGLGGLISNIAGNFLGGDFKKDETQSFESQHRNDDGGYTQTHTEVGRHGGRYGQAEVSDTHYPGGGERVEYDRYEQQQGRHRADEPSGFGYQERHDYRPSPSGGMEERVERRYETDNNSYQESTGWGHQGGHGNVSSHQQHGGHHGDNNRREEYGGRHEQSSWEGGRAERHEERFESRQETSYGGGSGYDGGRRDDFGGRRDEFGGGRRDEQESGGGGFLGGLVDNIRQGVEENFDDNDEQRRHGGPGGYGGQQGGYGGEQGGYGGEQGGYGGEQGGYGGQGRHHGGHHGGRY